MKGNKKILVVAILLLLITVSFATYAIYKSSATGEATVQTAAWIVKVNGDDIVTEDTFDFGSNDIVWATPGVSKVAGKIAPGDHGTIKFELDATGSEVDVAYEVEVGTITFTDSEDNETTLDNDELSVELAASDTGTLPYAASNMKKNVVLDVVWNAVDNATQNEADIDISNGTLTIPVTVTVRQDPGASNGNS